jgi:hypothetical protein
VGGKGPASTGEEDTLPESILVIGLDLRDPDLSKTLRSAGFRVDSRVFTSADFTIDRVENGNGLVGWLHYADGRLDAIVGNELTVKGNNLAFHRQVIQRDEILDLLGKPDYQGETSYAEKEIGSSGGVITDVWFKHDLRVDYKLGREKPYAVGAGLYSDVERRIGR